MRTVAFHEMSMTNRYRGRMPFDCDADDAFWAVGMANGVRREVRAFTEDCLTVHHEWLARAKVDPTLQEKVIVLVHALRHISAFTVEGRFESMFDMVERFGLNMTEMFQDVDGCSTLLLQRYSRP